MSIAETGAQTPAPGAEMKPNNRGSLRTIVFMVVAGLATLGWAGFLIWVALALLGF